LEFALFLQLAKVLKHQKSYTYGTSKYESVGLNIRFR